MDKKKTQTIITVAGIATIVAALIIICVLGVVVKRGNIQRSVKYGTATMKYVDKNEAAVSPMRPMDDDEALKSLNYFAFQVTSKEKGTQFIYFDPISGNTLDKKYVKTALTVFDGKKETIVGYPKMIEDFDNYVPEYGYQIYKSDIDPNVEYRFRAWIDIGADPKEVANKVFKVKIKAYGAA